MVLFLFMAAGARAADDWPRGLAEARGAADAAKNFQRLMADYPIECDWLLQDGGPDLDRWLAGRPCPDFEKNLIEKVWRELPSSTSSTRSIASMSSTASMALYARAGQARRAARLAAAPLPRAIVFTKHYNMGGSHYAYTEGQSDAQRERTFVAGSALCLLEIGDSPRAALGTVPPEPRVRTLLADPGGVIRDPEVSWDGKRILFAWKKSDRQDDYHLYELTMDQEHRLKAELPNKSLPSPASSLQPFIRQITSGLGFADYEGVYLPGGDILFTSTRCVQTVDCFWTEVSNLYRCAPDGARLRRLAFDQVHDNYPVVLPDGRVVYTRWEYNDRGQIYVQGLFQMSPDGTGQTEFYGNNSWFPTSILHARPIPGTRRLLAVLSGHHSRQAGKLAAIDPAAGRQEAAGVRLVAPPRETEAVHVDRYGQEGELFQYPYPLDENSCLVAYAPLGWARPLFGIYWMALDGRRELLATDPKVSCNQPIPLAPRPQPPVRPSMVDPQSATGTVYVQDVYAGPGLAGVARGTVKILRVIALDYRAAGVGMNTNRGPGGGALSSTPPSIGNGTWDVKSVLGDADVRADGSAFFKVPARTPVYFQLLDARGRLVQSMRSWTTLQPGENASCAGCHEDKNSSPPVYARPTRALAAGPQPLRPFYGPPRGFSFAREVQPILDRHCVRCHDGSGAPEKSFSLRGDPVRDPLAQRDWSRAYLALTHATAVKNKNDLLQYTGDPDHPLVNWIGAQSAPPMLPPRSAGSGHSGLLPLLDRGHYDAKLTREELDKLACWIDLGVPFCGDYTEAAAWTPEEHAFYQKYLDKRRAMEALERENLQELAADGK